MVGAMTAIPGEHIIPMYHKIEIYDLYADMMKNLGNDCYCADKADTLVRNFGNPKIHLFLFCMR